MTVIKKKLNKTKEVKDSITKQHENEKTGEIRDSKHSEKQHEEINISEES